MSTEANPGTEQAKSPSGVGEAFSMFTESQAKAAAETEKKEVPAASEVKAEEKKPESIEGSADKGKPAGEVVEKKGPTFRLVNEKGEPTPLVFRADDKDLSESDPDKIRQYVEHGYHASQRAETLNAKEKLVDSQLGILEAIDLAMKEGRLIIKELGKPGETPPAVAEKETEEDLLADPEVKALKERVKKTEEDLKRTAGLFVTGAIEKEVQELKSQINAKKAEFPNARESDVWKLLELQEEKTGKASYNAASAMKKSHEDETIYLESKPISEKRRQEVIAKYLADKAKAEEAPVGSPAGAAPGGVGGAAKEEEKPFTGVEDAMERYKRSLAKGGETSKF